jgi:hypothetical protein
MQYYLKPDPTGRTLGSAAPTGYGYGSISSSFGGAPRYGSMSTPQQLGNMNPSRLGMGQLPSMGSSQLPSGITQRDITESNRRALEQEKLRFSQEQLRFGQEQAMAPFQLRTTATEAGMGELGLERGRFSFGQEQAMAPFQLRTAAATAGMGELGLERGRYEFGEFQAGSGVREAERAAAMRGLTSESAMDMARKRLFAEDQASRGLAQGIGGYTGQIDPYYLEKARRERELEEMAMKKARFESSVYSGGGGFSAWATPAFPSMR